MRSYARKEAAGECCRSEHSPSPASILTAALARGAAAAEGVLAAHLAASPERAWPETVSVNLWGLDAIKTKGESVGLLLSLVGATPVRESTGRVVRYELKPLSALGGRPRIDVLANVSGIFRDSFSHVIELIDDMFGRAAAADEARATASKSASNRRRLARALHTSDRSPLAAAGDELHQKACAGGQGEGTGRPLRAALLQPRGRRAWRGSGFTPIIRSGIPLWLGNGRDTPPHRVL